MIIGTLSQLFGQNINIYFSFLASMRGLLLPCLFLVVGGQRLSVCPQPCSCLGRQVNCSSRSLTSPSMPTSFPPNTTKLHLDKNQLTSLPNGLLDGLTSLHFVSLRDNPWVCDCGILYLRAWLLRQPAALQAHWGVSCHSPASLRGRQVAYLTEEEVLESCHYWYCNLALTSQVCLLAFVVIQVALLIALLIFLRKFERLSKEARRTKEESFPSGDDFQQNEYMDFKDSRI